MVQQLREGLVNYWVTDKPLVLDSLGKVLLAKAATF
jgi:hypothetical protein